MLELSLRFESNEKQEDAPITVSLFRPDTGNLTQPAEFQPPLDDAVLADLSWYLEEFSKWPTGPDYIRANKIEAKLENWGRSLLESATREREAAQLWQQFLDSDGESKLVTIDATDPRVLRLPWELLADESGHLFPRGVSVRRRLRKTTATPTKPFNLPVRVLMVISRPEEAGFIDPRADALALLEALDGLGTAAEVEFLYPPTLAALTKRLRDTNAPAIHVVHFDGSSWYDARIGRGFLLFENDEHDKDFVDAKKIGILLSDCDVKLVVLGVNNDAMIAKYFRVGSVVIMNYSAFLAASRIFFSEFYCSLAHAKTISRAVYEGRLALHANEYRHTLTRRNEDGELVEKTVRLRDWFLPALYQQASDPVVFSGPAQPAATAAPKTTPLALTNPNLPGALPAASKYGFHGRSRELLQLERAFAKHAIVVLHGFGGMGKTTLAAEAGRWFYRTRRFPGGAAFVSFEHGGSLQQLCSWVGQAVSGDPNFALGEGNPVARVARLLQEKPALVILDSLEHVLGRTSHISNDELKAILDAVWLWAKGDDHLKNESYPEGRYGLSFLIRFKSRARKDLHLNSSRILITTRDTTFNDHRFSPSQHCQHMALHGLGLPDAREFAKVIFDVHDLPRGLVNRQELDDLISHLGYHPLSLELVLPRLKEYSFAEILSRFEELLPKFVAGKANGRNESLEVSLQLSLQRLNEAVLDVLPKLSLFQVGALEDDLLDISGIDRNKWQHICTELKQAALLSTEAVEGIDEEEFQRKWHIKYMKLKQKGLISTESVHRISGVFVSLHPTLSHHFLRTLSDSQSFEIENRFIERYSNLAQILNEMDRTNQTPRVRAVVKKILPNLLRTLQLMHLKADGGRAEFRKAIERLLRLLGYERDLRVLHKTLDSAHQSALTEADIQYSQMDRVRGDLYYAGRYREAGDECRRILDIVHLDDHSRAETLWNIGRCCAAQGRPRDAIEFYEMALAIIDSIDASSSEDKWWRLRGNCNCELGDAFRELGEFDRALNFLREAWEIDIKFNYPRGQAYDRLQIGILLCQKGDLSAAEEHIQNAYAEFQRCDEPKMEADVLYHLGIIAELRSDWEGAENCYRRSLELRDTSNNLVGMADTYYHLAVVSQNARRADDAMMWYLRAIELGEQFQSSRIANWYSSVSDFCFSQGRLAEAEHYAGRALAIKETLDLSATIWTTYNILAKIAQAKGNAQEAAHWRRKEQESYFAYPGVAYRLPQWAPAFIQTVAAAVQGNPNAKSEVEKILPRLEATRDWKTLIAPVRQILAGENDFEKLRPDLDRQDAYIVRRILAVLSGEPAPNERTVPTGEATAEQEESEDEAQGITIDDLLKFVALACQPDAPPQFVEQIHEIAQSLQSPEAPPEMHAFGRVLAAILSGERHPDLSALPPELARKIREHLAALP